MSTTAVTLTGILLLATLAEALVEYLVKPLLRPLPTQDGSPAPADPAREQLTDAIACYSAAAVGVLLCLAYQADMLSLAGLYTSWPWFGYVITGLLVGRGANFVHDFTGRWLGAMSPLG